MGPLDQVKKDLARASRLAALALLLGGAVIGYLFGAVQAPSEDQVRLGLYKACANNMWFTPDPEPGKESGCSRVQIDTLMAHIYERTYLPPVDGEYRQKYEAELLKYKKGE